MRQEDDGNIHTADRMPVLTGINVHLSRGQEVRPALQQTENGWTASGEGTEIRLRWESYSGASALMLEAAVPMIGTFDYNPVFANPCAVELELDTADYASHLALYQHKIWWMRPSWGNAAGEVPGRTQLLILRRDSEYEVFVCYCDRMTRADLSGTDHGLRLSVSTSVTNHDRLSGLLLLRSCGKDPYDAVGKCVRAIQTYSGGDVLLREKKTYPSVFAGEGWCSWDSMGRSVSEKLLVDKMEELRSKGHPVDWVLIDDGWSQTDQESETLTGFGADPERFPGGLAQTVRILKEKYHVRHVGVWQAVKGYWHGIRPGSEAHREAAPYLQKYGNGELSYRPDAASSFAFWSSWHGRLRKEGIDFVKIDGQSSFQDMVAGQADCMEALRQVYEGMEASAFLHFRGNLINCMGMGPENIWARTYSALSRTSDDYLPRELGSFPEHAGQNAYASILHGELYYGDWDMFWSSHPQALPGVLLRMISGGPLYTSDGIGRTDPALLAPAVGDAADVLRCDGIGRPTLDCLTERKRVLKLFNTCGDAVCVAAFDLEQGEGIAAGCIDLKDFPEGRAGTGWIYDWRAQKVERITERVPYCFDLQDGGAGIYTLIPDRGEKVTVIGIGDKYIPAAGVTGVRREGDNVSLEAVCGGTCIMEIRDCSVCVQIEGAGTEEFTSGSTDPQIIQVAVPEGGARIRILVRQ